MSIPKMTNDLAVIQKLSDLPNSTEGLTAEQLKAKFDEAPLEIQKYINEKLIPAIVATKIPFTPTTEINAENVDAAIREVQSQVKDASSGTIVNGSVTTEKLSAELLERVYGGRPWVSMDTPDSADNVSADFPIGQIWLRPAFTVVNAKGSSWVANGCTVAEAENKITVTGNQTVVTATATQAMTNIGQDGDRVYVLFGIENKDAEIQNLTVSLNSGEPQDAGAGVFVGTLVGGSLTVQISATWPSSSLAKGSFEVVNYAVVNVDQAVRQTVDAKEISDWAGYLSALLPLDSYTSPEEMYIQTINGSWWPMSYEVLPVSRGGTGLNAIGNGELLYGSGGLMQRLSVPTEEYSFLRFSGGKPSWTGVEDTIGGLGSLRIQTGSYTGTGTDRTQTLPVTPILLFIFGDDGSFVGLGQGTKSEGIYSHLNASYECTATLSGQNITYRGSRAGGEHRGGLHANGSGVVYKWFAVY